MPIVTPGKRPAKRFEKSKILGGKMGRGHKSLNAELNVVPMVDMMTMLVIFLLQQFSSTGEVMYMQKDIKLPDAQHGQMIEVAPVVAISAQQVVVTGVATKNVDYGVTFSNFVGAGKQFYHTGLLKSGDAPEWVYVFNGLEYKDANGAAAPDGVTAFVNPAGGAWTSVPVTLTTGQFVNTRITVP